MIFLQVGDYLTLLLKERGIVLHYALYYYYHVFHSGLVLLFDLW